MTAATIPHLHELGEARRILDDFLLEADGEETAPIAELWGHLEGQIEEKVERWALWILDRAGDARKLKEEESRLQAKRHALENACERSKAELLHQLQALGKTKVTGLLATVAVQVNSQPSVTTPLEASELWAVGDAREYVTREEKIVYAFDRSRILAAWQRGQVLPASIHVERGFHIRVR